MPKVSEGLFKKLYTDEDMVKAMEAVQQQGATIASAARQFNIPPTSLGNYVRGRSTIGKKAGPPEVENWMVEKVLEASRAGFPVTKNQFQVKVAALVNRMRLDTQFKNGMPGKDYWYSLKERRPDLAIRKPQNTDTNRLHMMSLDVVARYFDDLGINRFGTAMRLGCNFDQMGPESLQRKGPRT